MLQALSVHELMHINQLFGFEILRDGGSLIASFQADDACDYWVIFPKVGGFTDSPTYGKPALINRTTDVEVQISREAAKRWLDRLYPLMPESLDLPFRSYETQQTIAEKMYELCKHT